MTADDTRAFYTRYLACLSAREWARLGEFVADDVNHNGRLLGVAGYRAMLERDVQQIPDLRFEIATLLTEPDHIAARLHFDCTPAARFLDLPVNGRRVQFHEHVFYELRDGRIATVHSLLDRAAIEAQLI